MVKDFKSKKHYKVLLKFMEKHLDKETYKHLHPTLIKNKWPKEWIIEAHKDLIKKHKHQTKKPIKKDLNLSDVFHSKEKHHFYDKENKDDAIPEKNIKEILKTHKELNKVASKSKLDSSTENQLNNFNKLVEEIFQKHENKHHFYELSKEQLANDNQSGLNNSDLNQKDTTKILKEAISLAKEVVKSNKGSGSKSSGVDIEKMFKFEQEDQNPNELRKDPEKELLKEQIQGLKRQMQNYEEEVRRAKSKSRKSDENTTPAEKLRELESKGNHYDPNAFKNPVILDDISITNAPIGDRAETGIKGFDQITQGGFRRNTANLVAGGPGSGKTIMGMEFIINGATKFNEAGIYITFEQTREDLKKLFSDFEWKLDQLEEENKILILNLNPEQINKIIEAGGGSLRDAIESMNATRIAIDSMSDFLLLFNDDLSKRSACMRLFGMFERMQITTLAISEQETDPLKHISNVLEYQVDGVVLLYNERIGDVRQRALEVFKMRGTKHAGRIFPMKINSSGVEIRSNL